MRDSGRRPASATYVNRKLDAPALIAGFVASACALLMFAVATEASAFSMLALPMLVAGFVMSWLVSTGALARWVRDLTVGLILTVSALALFTVPQLAEMLADPYSVMPGDPRVAGFLAWLIVVYSFNLVSTSAVLFICVPSISLFGLAGTTGGGANPLFFFMIFLGASSFALMRQNSLSEDSRQVLRRDSAFTLARPHMALTGAIVAATLLVGALLGSAAFAYVDRIFISRWIGMYQTAMGSPGMLSGDYSRVMSGPTPQSDLEVMAVESPEGFL